MVRTLKKQRREWIKASVERRLVDIHKQNLSSTIFDNSQTKTYRIFKQSLNSDIENYLIELPKKDRIILCRFRCSNHQLPIVSGRYTNTPRNMRICSLCDMNTLGDEFHYLFECPVFDKDRQLYL